MKLTRIYVDTSVFGGCFDPDFIEPSNSIFEEVKDGRFNLVLSTTVIRELLDAPTQVREVLEKLPQTRIERIEISGEIEALRDAYLQHDVVGPGSSADAEHIASASVADVDLIVSWNFKHIVHYDKIRGYHAVNLMMGYRPIPIHTPQEVVHQDE